MSGLEAPVLAAIIGGGSLLGSTALGMSGKSKKITTPQTELAQLNTPEGLQALNDAWSKIQAMDPSALKEMYTAPYSGELNAPAISIDDIVSGLRGIGAPVSLGAAGSQAMRAYSDMVGSDTADIYNPDTPEGKARLAMNQSVSDAAAEERQRAESQLSERYASGGTLGSSGWGRSLGDVTRRTVEGVARDLASRDIGLQESAANRNLAERTTGAGGLAGIEGALSMARSYADMNRLAALGDMLRARQTQSGQQQESLNRNYADYLRRLETGMNFDINMPYNQMSAAGTYAAGTRKTPVQAAQTAYAPSTSQQIGMGLMNLVPQLVQSDWFNNLFGGGGNTNTYPGGYGDYSSGGDYWTRDYGNTDWGTPNTFNPPQGQWF